MHILQVTTLHRESSQAVQCQGSYGNQKGKGKKSILIERKKSMILLLLHSSRNCL